MFYICCYKHVKTRPSFEEWYKEHESEVLVLHNVSQQRELLIDYSNYLCKEYFNRHLEPDDCDVDEYLKSINCG